MGMSEALGNREWGPFYTQEFITNDYGEWGIPAGEVLYMTAGRTFDKKTGQWKAIAVPKYRPASEKQMKQAKRDHDSAIASMAELEAAFEDNG